MSPGGGQRPAVCRGAHRPADPAGPPEYRGNLRLGQLPEHREVPGDGGHPPEERGGVPGRLYQVVRLQRGPRPQLCPLHRPLPQTPAPVHRRGLLQLYDLPDGAAGAGEAGAAGAGGLLPGVL